MAEAGGGGKDTRNSSTLALVSNPNKDNNNDPETMTSSRNVEVKIGVPWGLTFFLKFKFTLQVVPENDVSLCVVSHSRQWPFFLGHLVCLFLIEA